MSNKVSIFKRFINYLGTFPNAFSENSTKLLALLLSALSGTFIGGVVIPFILIWDVVTNGYIKTDLADIGILYLCLGGFIFGSSVNVTVPKWAERHLGRKKPESLMEGEEEFAEEEEG